MSRIEELFLAGDSLPRADGSIEMDPLREADALQESQLVDLRLEAVSATAGLLFDLRTALQLQAGNSAVLLAEGVRQLTWSAEPRSTHWTAWNVVGSRTEVDGSTITLALDFFPNAGLTLIARRIQFWVGNVAALDEAPPDFADDPPAAVRAGLVSWQSDWAPNWTTTRAAP